jgi:hypothetical protein
MSDTPASLPPPGEIAFVIDRLVWTNAARYFTPVARSGPVYLRTGLTADRASHTHEACLLGLIEDGYVTEDDPVTECRLPVPDRGWVAMVPLDLTPRGRHYLRTLIDATTQGTTP